MDAGQKLCDMAEFLSGVILVGNGPVWDTAVLAQIGFSRIETDTGYGDRVYKERDEFYMPDRMFRIAAFKE